MRRSRTLGAVVTFVLFALVALVSRSSGAESVEDEQQALRARLASERAALQALAHRKTEVLAVLELLENLARTSAQRASVLERQLRMLSARRERIEAEQVALRERLQAQREKLSPRLAAMYRLHRQQRWSALLSAGDLASVVRRTRAMRHVIEHDAVILDEALRAHQAYVRAERRLESFRHAVTASLKMLNREAELARVRRAVFDEVLTLTRAETSRANRVIKELEVAERELSAMVAEMQAAIPASGFRSLKGTLPPPVSGIIEVGFGKVVNPKFNTVTVQKGLDLRAPMGAPVRAVADATVAYAGWLRGYGNLLILDHGGGYHSLMAHLAHTTVRVGELVHEGQVVGAVGDTASLKGAYLYFEIRYRGQAIDPGPWLRAPD